MPKRTDIQSIMIIGAGPIIIGQACEFDYSGAQACKALKAEEAARLLLIEWCKACGLHAATTQTLYCEAFLWNAAFPLNPAAPPEACFADAGMRLAMCGDWCVGPRAGDAWASGVAAANAVMRDML